MMLFLVSSLPFPLILSIWSAFFISLFFPHVHAFAFIYIEHILEDKMIKMLR